MTPSFDAGTYGRSFADVYDDWYSDQDPEPMVRLVDREVRRQVGDQIGSVLELGAGTGRLAIPIAELGHRVLALDSSDEMLTRLVAKEPPPNLTTVRGDASEAAQVPEGPFEVVLAAFNLLSNLRDRTAQRRCLAAAADRLTTGGAVIVEAFIAEPITHRTRDLVTKSVDVDAVVLIATETDPTTSSINGAHIEVRDGALRMRPWRVCVATPDEIDTMAAEAGLRLESRWANASGSPYVAGEHTQHCSIYRR